MALSSGGIAQFSAGAGRSYMVIWPTEADTPNNGSAPSGNMVGRGGINSVANGIGQSVGGTGVIQHIAYIPGNPGSYPASDSSNGQNVVMLKATIGTDSAKVQWNQGFMYYEQAQLAPGIQPDRLFRVFRFIMRANFPPLAAPITKTGADIGMCIVPGNVASMNGGANRPGIQFGPTDAGIMTLRSRKSFGAAYDFSQDFTYAQLGLPAAASGDTGFVTYEMRIISADNTAPAKLKVFCNEVQVGPTFNVSPADGRAPGPVGSGGGFVGYGCQVINSVPGVAYIWHLKYMALIMSPDEQGNL